MLSRIAATFPVLVALGLVAACGPKATKAECEKMIDHMTELQLQGVSEDVADMTRKILKEGSKELLAECEGKASQSEVLCITNAKSEAEMEGC